MSGRGEFGRSSQPTVEPTEAEDANGRPPGHPFFGMTNAEIERRLGDEPTDVDTEDDADAPDDERPDVTWRDCWTEVNAVVTERTCEILSATQVRLLAEIQDLPKPTERSHPPELTPAYAECGAFRGFVFGDREPVHDVPAVNDSIVASSMWSDSRTGDDDAAGEGETEGDAEADADGERVNTTEVLHRDG